MKLFMLAPLAMLMAGAAHAQSEPRPAADAAAQRQSAPRPSGPLQQKLAPGLATFTDEVLYKEVWPAPGLSQRDRSLVIMSALIATNKPTQLRGHLGRALTNGVTPVEASGLLTHLALYAGWPNAVSALEVYDQVYTERGVDFAALADAVPPLPPAASDAQEAGATLAEIGTVAPRFVDLTNRVVFGDLWRRSDLSLRDRHLVTIATLVAMGDDDLLDPYLRGGIEAGLTRDEISEALTHLAFYAGWGKATKALTTVNRVLGSQEAAP